jgi:hypothetical protein
MAEGNITNGMSRYAVVEILGQPKGHSSSKNKEVLFYERGKIELTDGKVFRVELISQAKLAEQLAAQPKPATGTEEELEESLCQLRQSFLSAVESNDGERAKEARSIFFVLREQYPSAFKEYEEKYRKCLEIRRNKNSPELLIKYDAQYMPKFRLYVWETMYEETAAMGISSEKIQSLLNDESPKQRLKKLKELKDAGLITESDYETRKKAVLNNL